MECVPQRHVTTVCAVLLLVATLSSGVHSAEAAQPNIVFILSDDMGWNDVGYHGSDVRTPNLDALAESGLKLENYYVQYQCSPTRGQLLTGRYQIHTGLQSANLPISCPCGMPLELPTVADRLRGCGYATHMVGKWHLGFYRDEYLPTSRGFDTHYGYYTGHEDYYTHERKGAIDFHDNLDNVRDYGYSTHLFRDRAVKIISKHPKDEPLFLYLPFQTAHAPMEAPQEYIDRNDHINDETRRSFAGMVSALDDAIGDITEALKDNGLWSNTLLIFSSDNGGRYKYGGNNWPLRGQKGAYFEGGVHVPGIVSGPFLPREGAISHQLIHVTDWFPTLINLAGGDTSGMALDGYDIWETLSEDKATSRREILHNIDPVAAPVGSVWPGSPFDNRIRAALRVGHWKIITGNPWRQNWLSIPDRPHLNATLKSDTDDLEKNLWLFNIAQDPEEKHDLSVDNPEILHLMLEKLAEYNAEAVAPLCVDVEPEDRYTPPENAFWEPWVQ